MNKLWQVTYEKNGVEHSIRAEAFNKTAAEGMARRHERGTWIDIIEIKEIK